MNGLHISLLGCLTASVAGLALACGSDAPEPTPTPAATALPTATPTPEAVLVQGSIVLLDDPVAFGAPLRLEAGDECEGSGGFSDIGPGMEVRLRGDGELIDVARLSSGRIQEGLELGVFAKCEFGFALRVEPGYTFYSVELGRRGEFNYRFSEMVTPGALSYTLGPRCLGWSGLPWT